LVQVGFGRAGFYSNDLLDNFARPSLREIDHKLQQLEVGQWVSMSPTPSERTAWKVDSFVQNEWLLWRKPDSTWSWVLRSLGGGRTRLVTRVHVRYDWSRPASAAVGLVLMELGDFAMMRRMLQAIKQRAEACQIAGEHIRTVSGDDYLISFGTDRRLEQCWLGIVVECGDGDVDLPGHRRRASTRP
jgi:hypothetical protein